MCKKFFNDFLDTILFVKIFKPIRVINRTVSGVIWTSLSEDITHCTKADAPLNITPSLSNQLWGSRGVVSVDQKVNRTVLTKSVNLIK